ncbi:RNA methyltransferase [Sandarakinorhabdus sp.]|uniref:RNA methyltransferase n=1 Tax=Sandarakinorhabdus sp. TaxID=1916663 RepID=UPI00286E6212|nr:RNA methyltransferase [Sandarakinorhabdus sp.]
MTGPEPLVRPSIDAPPPAVILVRPQLGMNIGAVARAMLNFGLTDLRLVQPRDGWPNADAGPSAVGADIVLDGATVHDSLADACKGLTLVLATAMDTRDMTRRVVTPTQAVKEFIALPAGGGLVFGPERTGLVRADLLQCHAICTIPSNPDFGSLNLAQSVAVLGYEWVRQRHDGLAETVINHPGPALHNELQDLITAIDAKLAEHGYYSPEEGRAAAAKRMMINMFTRPQFSGEEVRSLRGIVRGLVAPRANRARPTQPSS